MLVISTGSTSQKLRMDAKASELTVAFLEVDTGDTTVVLIPGGGEAMLVDCGMGSADNVLDFLKQAEVRLLKLVMITHSDLDHAGGVIELLNNFGGQTAYLAFLPDRVRQASTYADRSYRVLLREIAQLWREGATPCSPYAGVRFEFGELIVSVLHPAEADFFAALSQNNRNDASVVLRLEYQERRILLGADVQKQGWQWMKDRGTDLAADIFKFPHHGAWYNGNPSLSEILDLVHPSTVIVSVNSNNRYGHPSMETLKLLRTHSSIVRFVCTEATTKCHQELLSVSSKARSILEGVSWQTQGDAACPCAGTIVAHVYKGAVDLVPSQEQHQLIIKLLDCPQCKIKP